MICNKCGKNNDAEAINCINCGETLPTSTNCGGFSDILTFTPPAAGVPEAVAVVEQPKGETLSNAEKKRLEEKAKRGVKFGIFAIVLSVLLSACTAYYAYTLSAKISKLERVVSDPTSMMFDLFVNNSEIAPGTEAEAETEAVAETEELESEDENASVDVTETEKNDKK